MRPRSKKGWALYGAIGIVVLFVLIGIFAPAPEPEPSATTTQAEATSETAAATQETATTEPATTEETTTEETTTEEESAPALPTPRDNVNRDLREVDGTDVGANTVEIRNVQFGGGGVTVTAKTPEGGFEGPSVKDLDQEAAVIFGAVYKQSGWNREAVVVFKGGLVDSSTGEELPDANTGIYTMPPGQASRIDWSDEETLLYVIDWSLYRDFAHPALKQ